MKNCKCVDTPLAASVKLIKEDNAEKINATIYRILVGCLLHLTTTRPDIQFATSVLSRFMHSLSVLYINFAKRVLRYLKGTSGLGVLYKSFDNCK